MESSFGKCVKSLPKILDSNLFSILENSELLKKLNPNPYVVVLVERLTTKGLFSISVVIKSFTVDGVDQLESNPPYLNFKQSGFCPVRKLKFITLELLQKNGQ